MDKKSILINQIQQLVGVERVTHICVSPEEPDMMLVEIHLDPESVVDEDNTIEASNIDLNELLYYKNTQTHLYAKHGKKELMLTFNGSYEVWNGREKVFETMQPYSAISFYNELGKSNERTY